MTDSAGSGPHGIHTFFGDSITHGGRYHEFVADYYLTRFPEADIRFVNYRGCNAGLSLLARHVLEQAKADGTFAVDWYAPLQAFLVKQRTNSTGAVPC